MLGARIGKVTVTSARLARRCAEKLLFKAGDELTRAQRQRVIGGGAAFERFASNAAGEIERHLVAVFGRGVLVVKILRLFGEVLQRLVHRGVVGLDHQTLSVMPLKSGLAMSGRAS